MLFVGDSVTTQQWVNLYCAMERSGAVEHKHAHESLLVPTYPSHAYVALSRTNVLYVVNANGTFDFDKYHWSTRVPNASRGGRKLLLVINTGAWFSQHKLHEDLHVHVKSAHDADRVFRTVIDRLFDHTLSQFRGTVIFRSISPGHIHSCAAITSPLFNWDSFNEKNVYVREKIKNRENMYYLDIETMVSSETVMGGEIRQLKVFWFRALNVRMVILVVLQHRDMKGELSLQCEKSIVVHE